MTDSARPSGARAAIVVAAAGAVFTVCLMLVVTEPWAMGPGGLLVLDVFGGPGAMRTGIQRRTVTPLDADEPIPPFTYEWEQRSFDALSGRVDCRIHFDLPGRRLNNAFRYDWRLWTLPELLDCLEEAGFSRTEVWCDRYDPRQGHSDGIYRPIKSLPAREDWVAYVVGCR